MRAVCAFARRRGINEELALEVFRSEFSRLDSDAKVHRFVPVIAEKHTRTVLVRVLDGQLPNGDV
jgi:hypothetical protein